NFSISLAQNFLDIGGMGLMWGRAAVICLAGPDRAAFACCGAACRQWGWITRLGRTVMRQNALLRSGKGLAGTARKKLGSVCVVQPAHQRAGDKGEREDHFAVRNGVRCAGVHLIIDLHGAAGLDDIDLIEATLRRCVEASRATLLHIHLHHFQPNGVSGVAVLAESHISIHTWPDAGYAALDVFMCGKASPDA